MTIPLPNCQGRFRIEHQALLPLTNRDGKSPLHACSFRSAKPLQGLTTIVQFFLHYVNRFLKKYDKL